MYSPLCCLQQGDPDSIEPVRGGRGEAPLSHSDTETESSPRPVEKEAAAVACELRDNGP